jgi:hypothetical protein
MVDNSATRALLNMVTGAIERGEGKSIVAWEVTTIRDFASHSDALKAQEADRKDGYRVGDWFAYQGVTSYVVTLPRELADVKREGQS